jgi:hypothetical protein
LVPCCRDCNSVKGGKTFQEYIDVGYRTIA